jgi:hypothetical protein
MAMLACSAGFFTGAVTAIAGIILAGRAHRQQRLQPAQVQRALTPEQALHDTKARVEVLTWRRSSWPHQHIPEA